MNFQSLNLNLNQKKIEKEFFKPYGQWAETGARPSSRWCTRPAPAQPQNQAGLARPIRQWAGPRGRGDSVRLEGVLQRMVHMHGDHRSMTSDEVYTGGFPVPWRTCPAKELDQLAPKSGRRKEAAHQDTRASAAAMVYGVVQWSSRWTCMIGTILGPRHNTKNGMGGTRRRGSLRKAAWR
jgi:hypothetical protein